MSEIKELQDEIEFCKKAINHYSKRRRLSKMKLKINGFKKITAKPVVDTFTTYTLDGTYMNLTVREDNTGKYFVIETTFQVYGWTTDAHKAFGFFNNIVPIYNLHQIYELARGRKV